LLALEQCIRRNLQPGPLNTYQGWLERKRQVRKGEKGITLNGQPLGCPFSIFRWNHRQNAEREILEESHDRTHQERIAQAPPHS
jgi:hypothetical protein